MLAIMCFLGKNNPVKYSVFVALCFQWAIFSLNIYLIVIVSFRLAMFQMLFCFRPFHKIYGLRPTVLLKYC